MTNVQGYTVFNIRKVVFIFVALLCFGEANAQTESHSFLNITTGSADDDEVKEHRSVEKPGYHTCGDHKHFYKYFNIDFGTSNLYYEIGKGKRTTHGPTGAISGQVAYKFHTCKEYRQLFLSAGLELRTLNTIYTFSDAKYGVVNDYVHLLYAGIPVMFQYINTKHSEGSKNDINLYAQAGMSFGYRAYFYQYRRDHKKTWDDRKENYEPLLLQPFASAGLSYTTKNNVFLLGPFFAYSVNDISSLSAVKGHFASYGFRISMLMLK